MRQTAIVRALFTLLLALGIGAACVQGGTKADRTKLFSPAKLNEKAPDKFQVKFDTSKGEFIVEVTRSWAPLGADRFYNLVKNGYYKDCRFFRVIEGAIAQFGLSGDPNLNNVWYRETIKDDPVKQSNTRGFISYAKGGKDTRTTQLFINLRDLSRLDAQGFAPFAKVVKGIEVVDSLYSKYGDGPPNGTGPEQSQIHSKGNAYLQKSFPDLDYIKSAVIVEDTAK